LLNFFGNPLMPPCIAPQMLPKLSSRT
jgi:hypothetical protein